MSGAIHLENGHIKLKSRPWLHKLRPNVADHMITRYNAGIYFQMPGQLYSVMLCFLGGVRYKVKIINLNVSWKQHLRPRMCMHAGGTHRQQLAVTSQTVVTNQLAVTSQTVVTNQLAVTSNLLHVLTFCVSCRRPGSHASAPA